MDNCPTHNNAQQLVDDWLQLQEDTEPGITRQFEVLYTLTYSPDLCLVEPIDGLITTRVSQPGFAVKDVYYSRPKIHGKGITHVFDKDISLLGQKDLLNLQYTRPINHKNRYLFTKL